MVRIKPVRVMKRGHYFQLYFYNHLQKRRRISAGNNYLVAQKMAVRFTDWLIDGKDPEKEYRNLKVKDDSLPMTLRESYPIFMKRHGNFKSKSMQISYDKSFRIICSKSNLADISLEEIIPSLLSNYMHKRLEEDNVKPATVNREAEFLKSLFTKAVDWGFLHTNQLRGMKLFKETNKRNVKLTLEQVKALVDILPETISDIVECAIYTGFRKENLLSLRIENIEFDDSGTGRVEIIVKGNRKEVFPLGPQCCKLLKRVIDNRKTGYVFTNPKTGTRFVSIHKSFDIAVRKLDLTVDGTKLRFHDLRHCFANFLHDNGVSLDSLRFLMGHKNRDTTDRYTTVDSMGMGKYLSLIPDIRNDDDMKPR